MREWLGEVRHKLTQVLVVADPVLVLDRDGPLVSILVGPRGEDVETISRHIALGLNEGQLCEAESIREDVQIVRQPGRVVARLAPEDSCAVGYRPSFPYSRRLNPHRAAPTLCARAHLRTSDTAHRSPRAHESTGAGKFGAPAELVGSLLGDAEELGDLNQAKERRSTGHSSESMLASRLTRAWGLYSGEPGSPPPLPGAPGQFRSWSASNSFFGSDTPKRWWSLA